MFTSPKESFSSLIPPPPSPTLFVTLFFWLNVWLCDICVILLNDIIDLHLSSLSTRSTLLCVLCNKASSLLQVCCSLLQVYCNFTFYTSSTLIWYQTHRKIHTGANRLTYKYILTSHCNSHSSYLYYFELIIHWYQKHILLRSIIFLFFKNYSPAEGEFHISVVEPQHPPSQISFKFGTVAGPNGANKITKFQIAIIYFSSYKDLKFCPKWPFYIRCLWSQS